MKITGNFVVGVVTELICYPMALATSVILARQLGPEHRGIFALVLTLAGFASNVALFGMGDATRIQAAKKEVALARLHGQSIVFSLAIGVVLVSSYWLIPSHVPSSLFPDVPASFLLFALVGVPLILYGTITDALLVGVNWIGGLSSFKLLRILSDIVTAGIVFFLLSGTIDVLVHGWIVALLVVAVLRFLYLHRTLGTDGSLGWRDVRSSLTFRFQNHLALIPALVVLQADVFLINHFAGSAQAGYYAVATGLATRFALLFSNLIVSASHGITGNTRESSDALVCKVVRHLVMGMLPVAVAMVFLAGFVVRVLYGSPFAPAAIPLVLLCFALLGQQIRDTFSIHLQGQLKRPLLAAGINWCVMVLALILYFILIPRFGATGAALASLVCYWTNAVANLLIFLHVSKCAVRDLRPFAKRDLGDLLDSIRGLAEPLGCRSLAPSHSRRAK